MRQTLDQLQSIYEGMIEGLLITDTETKRFVRGTGLLPDARLLRRGIAGEVHTDIHPPEEVPNDERRFQAAAEGRVSINAERPVLGRTAASSMPTSRAIGLSTTNGLVCWPCFVMLPNEDRLRRN